MIKFIAIIFALIVLGYFIARPFLQANSKAYQKPKDKKGKGEVIEEMQECATCGTYITTHDALLAHGHYFCSSSCKERFSHP